MGRLREPLLEYTFLSSRRSSSDERPAERAPWGGVGRALDLARLVWCDARAMWHASAPLALSLGEGAAMLWCYEAFVPGAVRTRSGAEHFVYSPAASAEDVLGISLVRSLLGTAAAVVGGRGTARNAPYALVACSLAAISLPVSLAKADLVRTSAWKHVPGAVERFLVFYLVHAVFAILHLLTARAVFGWARRRARRGLLGRGWPWEPGEASWVMRGEIEGRRRARLLYSSAGSVEDAIGSLGAGLCPATTDALAAGPDPLSSESEPDGSDSGRDDDGDDDDDGDEGRGMPGDATKGGGPDQNPDPDGEAESGRGVGPTAGVAGQGAGGAPARAVRGRGPRRTAVRAVVRGRPLARAPSDPGARAGAAAAVAAAASAAAAAAMARRRQEEAARRGAPADPEALGAVLPGAGRFLTDCPGGLTIHYGSVGPSTGARPRAHAPLGGGRSASCAPPSRRRGVVLVHAFDSAGASWHSVVTPLADQTGAEIFVPDLPGAGLSSRPRPLEGPRATAVGSPVPVPGTAAPGAPFHSPAYGGVASAPAGHGAYGQHPPYTHSSYARPLHFHGDDRLGGTGTLKGVPLGGATLAASGLVAPSGKSLEKMLSGLAQGSAAGGAAAAAGVGGGVPGPAHPGAPGTSLPGAPAVDAGAPPASSRRLLRGRTSSPASPASSSSSLSQLGLGRSPSLNQLGPSRPPSLNQQPHGRAPAPVQDPYSLTFQARLLVHVAARAGLEDVVFVGVGDGALLAATAAALLADSAARAARRVARRAPGGGSGPRDVSPGVGALPPPQPLSRTPSPPPAGSSPPRDAGVPAAPPEAAAAWPDAAVAGVPPAGPDASAPNPSRLPPRPGPAHGRPPVRTFSPPSPAPLPPLAPGRHLSASPSILARLPPLRVVGTALVSPRMDGLVGAQHERALARLGRAGQLALALTAPPTGSRLLDRRAWGRPGSPAAREARRVLAPLLAASGRLRGSADARARRLAAATRVRASDRRAIARTLGATAVPVLVVAGERDRDVPPELARRVAREAGASRLAVMPRTGCFPAEESPAGLAAILAEFCLDCFERVDEVPGVHDHPAEAAGN